MCILTALVGMNYIVICRHYPDGGGVYASVRHRSEIISIVGAFLLDRRLYRHRGALLAIGVPVSGGGRSHLHPEFWAGGAIIFIGCLNFFGPKHTGGLAFLVSVPTFIVVVLLALFCMPHMGEAVHNLKPLTGGFWPNWTAFVGVVLALSGVEAIANATGVMKLDPGAPTITPRSRKPRPKRSSSWPSRCAV